MATTRMTRARGTVVHSDHQDDEGTDDEGVEDAEGAGHRHA